MRIAVVGGGPMGSLFAGRLALAGHGVTLVEVDPARLAQLQGGGLAINLAGEALHVDLPCVVPQDLAAGQDMLLLFTKFAALRPALEGALHGLHAGGAVAAFANGLGVAEALDGLIPVASLMLAVTDVAADLREGVTQSDGSGQVKIGMADAAGSVEALAQLQTCLMQAGFTVIAQSDIRVGIWQKLALNAAFNALSALTDARVADLDNGPGRRIAGALLEETVAVAHAQGIALDRDALAAHIDSAFEHQGAHRPSMAQDRRAGRKTEIEAINGAIAACGERLGVPVPVNSTLADLMRLTGG